MKRSSYKVLSIDFDYFSFLHFVLFLLYFVLLFLFYKDNKLYIVIKSALKKTKIDADHNLLILFSVCDSEFH